MARDLALRLVVDVGRVVIKRRQRANVADHYRHGVRVAPIAREEPRHLFVHHRMVRDGAPKIDELRVGRQLAVKQQIANSQKIGVLR